MTALSESRLHFLKTRSNLFQIEKEIPFSLERRNKTHDVAVFQGKIETEFYQSSFSQNEPWHFMRKSIDFLIIGLVGAIIGGIIGVVSNVIASLLLFVLLSLVTGKSWWIGNLLFAVAYGIILGGATGAAISFRLCKASLLSYLASVIGSILTSWVILGKDSYRNHEFWWTAAIPILWAILLFIWGTVDILWNRSRN